MLTPRKAVAALEAYTSPIIARASLNLDLNENQAGCSPRVLAKLRTITADDLARYPKREVGERRMAEFLGVSPEQVLLTNGADDALAYLFATYLSEDAEIILADPTFVMYPMLAQAFGAQLVRVPPAENFAFPAAAILEHVSSHTRVIPIANPNNPTGTVAAKGDLIKIAQSAPDAAVLVDEAYFEFYGETMLPETRNYPNLFVLRTFSKAYGLAGLRLGALIGPAEQIDHIRRFCPPFNVNALALACLDEALADQSFPRNYVAQVKQGRERLQELCQELGLQYCPSAASFVFVRVGPQATRFTEALAQSGIIIRDFSASPSSPGCVRITIPVGDQIDFLLTGMREALQAVRK